MTVSEVEVIQKKIEIKKTELTRAEGKKEQLMSQLKDDFGCNTIEDAEAMVIQLKIDIEGMEKDASQIGIEIEELINKGVI